MWLSCRVGTLLYEREAMPELIAEIVSGRYQEGDLILESEVADRFGFSKPVARECIRALDARGMLEQRQGRGAKVQNRERWDTLDDAVLTALLASDQAPDALSEFLECRRVLEVEAAGLAAERATEVHLRSLRAAFERMQARAQEAQRDRAAEERYQQADIAFHREILLATRNPALAALAAPVHRALSSTVSALARPEDRFERGLPEHEAILDAIAAGQANAAREAMRSHLATVEGYLSDLKRR